MNKFLFFPLYFLISFKAFSCSDLLDSDMRILDSSESENLCKYEGKTILVVNVASRCGYTYQYSDLQNLYEKYKDNNFVVLGFPSRDFFQEYSDESAVAEFCSTEYGVEFPMFATVKVRGKKAHPFYKKLKAESGVEPTWNFNKYLISKEGKVVSTFKSGVKPDSEELITAIENIL
ncbi:MAG: glutathione peroxidase [Proteobacteria bacterium]|nr:glutathione peroxidase [Pseudomonadota bacterium]MDA1037788.1 glutathione peroxidase [Pseudomonadota bacterium]